MSEQIYTSEKFKVIAQGSAPFSISAASAVKALESISASEKAQAVPVAKIWEIDPKTGFAMHPGSNNFDPAFPLSVHTAKPADFGDTLDSQDSRFSERPLVSLERIAIKTQNPRGDTLYRTVEIQFVVHRPEIIFDKHVDDNNKHASSQDSWSSLLIPGQAFCLEYGWSASPGATNGILTGEFNVDEKYITASGDSKIIKVDATKRISFIVTSYTFQILQDNQMKFNIKAYELGEVGLRRAFLTDQKNSENKKDNDDAESLRRLLKKFKQELSEANGKTEKAKKTPVRTVRFGHLLHFLFADLIRSALGPENVEGIYVGRLNKRAGTPQKKYGGQSVSGTPISDFILPLDDIEKIFSERIRNGTQMTLYNFIEPFLKLFSSPEIWDRKGDDKEKFSNRTIPQIVMKTMTGKNESGRLMTAFYFFDINEAYVNITSNDSEKLNENAPRSQIRQALESKSIPVPFISLVKGNSYIKDAMFDTIQDEKMSSIFITRYFGKTDADRKGVTQGKPGENKGGKTPPAQQIYSPVIQGKITMLGNFVFDTFALVWVDFGVYRWDGPFNLYEREDIIAPGEFTTSWTVISAGTDPLGTQGRPKQVV